MPTDYLVDMYADSLTHDATSLRFLVERLGAGQVLPEATIPSISVRRIRSAS